MYAGADRFGFRLVHVSVQSNHLHIVAEARDRRSLSRGLWDVGAHAGGCEACHNPESPTYDPQRYVRPDGTTTGFDFEIAKTRVPHPIPEHVKGNYLALEKEQKARENRRAALIQRERSARAAASGFSEQVSLFASSSNPLQTRSIEHFGRTLTARDPPSGEPSTLEPVSERQHSFKPSRVEDMLSFLDGPSPPRSFIQNPSTEHSTLSATKKVTKTSAIGLIRYPRSQKPIGKSSNK